MRRLGRNDYFGSPRANNINSLPFTYHTERVKGGIDIYLYFKPNQVYPVHIWGKAGLQNVTQLTDLTVVYDYFYIAYLRYKLAERICEENNITFTKGATLAEYEAKLLDGSSAYDLSIRKLSTLTHGGSFNYAAANLGRGWTSP
jgi:hypothetical protein